MCKILLNKDDANLTVIVTLFELSHASVHNGIWDVQVIQFSIQMCWFLHAGRSFPWFSLVLAKLFWYQCVQDCAIPAFTVTTINLLPVWDKHCCIRDKLHVTVNVTNIPSCCRMKSEMAFQTPTTFLFVNENIKCGYGFTWLFRFLFCSASLWLAIPCIWTV